MCIRDRTGTDLPEGFQRAEFLLEHGMVDMVLPREEMRDRLADILAINLHNNKKASREDR